MTAHLGQAKESKRRSAVDERKYWVGFNMVRGIGPARVRALQAFFGSLKDAWHASAQDLREAGLDRRSLENLLVARRQIDLDPGNGAAGTGWRSGVDLGGP